MDQSGETHDDPAGETAALQQQLAVLRLRLEQVEQESAERDQLAATLRLAERRLRLIASLSGDSIYEVALPNQRFYIHSRDTYSAASLQVEQLGLDYWQEAIHEEDRERVLQARQRLLHDGTPFHEEYRFRLPHGQWIHLVDRSTLLEMEDPPYRCQIGVTTDITEQVQQKAARKVLEREVQQMRHLESLIAMAGGISHDYNNMLMAIMGNTELALELAPQQPPLQRTLHAIFQAAQRAADLTAKMLAYAGPQPLEVQPVSLNALIQALQDLLRASLPPGVQITYQLDPQLPLIPACSLQLRQVLTNLITNAFEAMSSHGGELCITTKLVACTQDDLVGLIFGHERQPGAYVQLSMRDTGHGIDQATLERIFEPFFSTRFVGRGLGLAVVHGVVRGHGGMLHVESQPGQGTTCHLWLPVNPTSAAKPAASVVDAVPASQPHATKHVLVIDDDPAVRVVTGRMLSKLGCTMCEAADGLAGLAKLEELGDQIELVLVDLTMPVMSGGAVAAAVLAQHPTLPVILMSGYAAHEVTRQYQHLPLAGVLQKPFRLDELQGVLYHVRL
ncbi:hybrid sensor histidine kinase/response regulator [Candidatus Viridilinea mediisalina]|uniref:histidine kinase n=1 Tax=Candidatus Viridilinea mediisalina TaxID=2024553 RepID=A0A2A6RG48_9CHLR|nr:ATP-binding protein [Candidatus Viridilinea mediisalina]PDW01866.1 hypothetical protein CJ255_16855 [Candidatus Viridilinea mediisalina]